LSTEAEFWKWMALKKEGSTIKIPRRQFLGASPEVEKAVREIIEENLTEFFEHDIKFDMK
ncbi:MAG: phage morphogenesis protein, partial [Muribaculaceae bacterium]|nr:phage morphogenesis protein [Muribaculaceae bacterium]